MHTTQEYPNPGTSRVFNKTRSVILADEVVIAQRIFSRLKGLLGRRNFKPGEALVITPCNSVHTFFMRFPIDLVFLDCQNRVIAVKAHLKPWRLTTIYWRAKCVIELPQGIIQDSHTQIGDQLILS